MWLADHFQTRGVQLEQNADQKNNSENYGGAHVILNNKEGKHLRLTETAVRGFNTFIKNMLSILNLKLLSLSLSLSLFLS
jgi:hypothetical protein